MLSCRTWYTYTKGKSWLHKLNFANSLEIPVVVFVSMKGRWPPLLAKLSGGSW